jgi:hypothetical protein
MAMSGGFLGRKSQGRACLVMWQQDKSILCEVGGGYCWREGDGAHSGSRNCIVFYYLSLLLLL